MFPCSLPRSEVVRTEIADRPARPTQICSKTNTFDESKQFRPKRDKKPKRSKDVFYCFHENHVFHSPYVLRIWAKIVEKHKIWMQK